MASYDLADGSEKSPFDSSEAVLPAAHASGVAQGDTKAGPGMALALTVAPGNSRPACSAHCLHPRLRWWERPPAPVARAAPVGCAASVSMRGRPFLIGR